MAYMTVTSEDGTMTMRERVTPEQIESDHYRTCLAERIAWAVQDTADDDEDD